MSITAASRVDLNITVINRIQESYLRIMQFVGKILKFATNTSLIFTIFIAV